MWCNYFSRSASLWALRRSSPEQTRLLIRNAFTIVLLQCLKIQRSDMRSTTSLYGGTGKSNYWVSWLTIWGGYFDSQIFPQYSSSKQPPPKNSALAKIKERRERKKAALMAAQTNSVVMIPSEHGWVLRVFIHVFLYHFTSYYLFSMASIITFPVSRIPLLFCIPIGFILISSDRFSAQMGALFQASMLSYLTCSNLPCPHTIVITDRDW